MLDTKLQAEIDALPDEASVYEVVTACRHRCSAIMDTKIAALPEFPTMMRVDGEGQPVEVTREVAAGMLRAGTHRVVTA
jgi:hypothetical protein